uniref:Uncharacterized protein n=1 Tax=Avena sativa TaxID=4498 RepID=A0ACD5UZJ8_AVESA
MRQGWTPVHIECREFLGGPMSTVILYSRPSPASQHHWPADTNADDERAEQLRVGRRQSPQVEGATRVVRLSGMLLSLSLDELRGDESYYQELLEEISDEARKFGDLVKVVIPRPGPDPVVVAGVGKVLLEYACLDHSIHCWEDMNGRWFATRQIASGFYPEDMFAAGDYSFEDEDRR